MEQPELDFVSQAVLDSYGRCLKAQVRLYGMDHCSYQTRTLFFE